MDRIETSSAQPIDSTAEQERFEREAAMLAEARAELDAGLFVTEEEVDAWIDSLGSDHERPLPGRSLGH